jgi:hypothetical protein
MTARYAVYFAPAVESLLWQTGSAWLGRDARSEAYVPQPQIEGISAERLQALTASPRRYGLHATLKPPFHLNDGVTVDMLRDALRDRCVAQVDRFRRPMDSAELAQRRASGLTENQETLLMRYGYPYVMTEWRFHITLSEHVVGSQRDVLMSWLKGYFAAALAAPIRCEDVCLFVQDGAGAPFLLRERFAFRTGGQSEK